ncbi:response regulator [Streptosporangium soli]|nr:hypothetical protein [Streptosporangium sp. KLBMP 9127]
MSNGLPVGVALIGPGDLVSRVEAVCAEYPDVRPIALPYGHEDETVDLVRAAHDEADALLFTGVVPWTMAQEARLLDRPAAYVSYNGATLLRGLVELLRLGHDVSGASIDILPPGQVEETMREAHLPTAKLQILGYRPGLTSEDFVAFHRLARERGATVAITCLRSTYEVVEHDLPALRLLPSRHSIRDALGTLVLRVRDARSTDAQIAIGLIELDPGGRVDVRELTALGGSLARVDGDTYLLITTRGPLRELTHDFTRLPLLDTLGAGARIGLGLGGTAAQAEARARRALTRAGKLGPKSAVAALDEGTEVILSAAPADSVTPATPASLTVVSRRVGLRKETLQRLRGLAEAEATGELTARTVSTGLGIEEGSARRLLKRLERAGLAEQIGSRNEGRSGRPPVIYRIRL